MSTSELDALLPGACLTPPLAAAVDLNNAQDLAELITRSPDPPQRDETSPRLLRVTSEANRSTITLVCGDDDIAGATLVTATASAPATLDHSDGRLHQLHAPAVAPGALCHAALADGRRTAQVRATDVDAVLAKPGMGSPLDDNGLSTALRSHALTRKLLDALIELAATCPDDDPHGGGRSPTVAVRGAWRRHSERIAGSALVTLALGRATTEARDRVENDDPSDEPDTGQHDLGDVVSETQDDDEGEATLFDEDADVDTGIKDIFDPGLDPVSALAADPTSGRRLAAAIDRRREGVDTWNPVALLALLRLAYVVAAAGGWDRTDAAWTITVILNALIGAEQDDSDLTESRDAAFLVGLALIREAIDDWDKIPDGLPDWFEHLRATANIDPDSIQRTQVEHYAADLHLTYGSTLSIDALMDAAGYLVATSALARALEDAYSGIGLHAERRIGVEVKKPALPTALRLLDALDDHAALAVHVRGSDCAVHAAWQPKRLTIQCFTPTGAPVGGAQHTLIVGPDAHRGGRLPQPTSRCTGEPPDEIRTSMAADRVDPPAP